MKRLTFLLILSWVFLIGTWMVARSRARNEFFRQVEAARSRGEPIDPKAFASDPVPDDQNAVTYLRLAIASYTDNPEETGANWEELHADPLSSTAIAAIRGYLITNANTLKHLREARQCSRADWKFIPTARFTGQDPVGRMVIEVSRCYELMQLARDAALIAQADGDDAAAFEYLHDMTALVRALDQAPSILAHVVRTSLDSHIAVAVEGMTVSMKKHPTATTRPATSATIAAMIAELLDDRPSFEMGRRANFADRAYTIEALDMPPMRWINNNSAPYRQVLSINERIINKIFEPSDWWNAVQNFRVMTLTADALQQPDYRAALSIMGAPPAAVPQTQLPILDWLNHTRNVYRNWIYQDYFGATCRHMAATLFALRLYQLDHNDALPTTLQELVPRYLLSVPIDLMAAGAKPIGYVAGPNCFVYSVYINGKDDVAAGWVPTLKDHHFLPRSDFISFLNPKPATQPATAPAK
jgi:hypothetical protein